MWASICTTKYSPCSAKPSIIGIGIESSPPITTGTAPWATICETVERIRSRFAGASDSSKSRSPKSMAFTPFGKIGPPKSKSM